MSSLDGMAIVTAVAADETELAEQLILSLDVRELRTTLAWCAATAAVYIESAAVDMGMDVHDWLSQLGLKLAGIDGAPT